MKTLMIAAALCTGMMSAHAQSTPTDTKTKSSTQTPTSQKEMKDCLKTSDAEWKALGLTAEQMTQVKAIQDEHKQACASMKKDEAGMRKDDAGMRKDDAATSEMVDKHEARIKEVLSPTQYDSWMKQCTAMASPAKPMEKK